MSLVVDYRERAVMQALTDKIPATLKNMVIGDMAVLHNDVEVVLVERKTVADLAASICDGRYKDQSARLLETGLPVVYLIEGSLNKGTSVPKKTMISAMVSMMLGKGFSVITTENLDDTATFLTCLTEKVAKEGGFQGALKKEEVVKKAKKDKITPSTIDQLMLCQIPSVSATTAKVILQAYPTVFLLTAALRENPDCLNELTTKVGKLPKKTILTLKTYLVKS
jgi:ERCC4-type nuclease